MITFTSSKNRFSLYYLEESEKYIQDLSAKVRHHNFSTGEERYHIFNPDWKEEKYTFVQGL
jgi:hypothetical protein